MDRSEEDVSGSESEVVSLKKIKTKDRGMADRLHTAGSILLRLHTAGSIQLRLHTAGSTI